ncbi:hypothetical protein GGR50DRAFT_177579 [Xylaria sp. CBS 124048]|nr:hypothetical protein GGR50DRAFT_177579 [Xylaria sp. CBS 124048]
MYLGTPPVDRIHLVVGPRIRCYYPELSRYRIAARDISLSCCIGVWMVTLAQQAQLWNRPHGLRGSLNQSIMLISLKTRLYFDNYQSALSLAIRLYIKGDTYIGVPSSILRVTLQLRTATISLSMLSIIPLDVLETSFSPSLTISVFVGAGVRVTHDNGMGKTTDRAVNSSARITGRIRYINLTKPIFVNLDHQALYIIPQR